MAETSEKNYSERYVGFLDILGFSNIVNSSAASLEGAKKLIDAVEKIASFHQEYSESDPDDFQAQTFSDCIVMSENASPGGLAHLMSALSHASLELLELGIFVRGGLAKGLLYHSGQVVIGPALIKAYRIESTTARFPRILIDELTHLDFDKPDYEKARSEWDIEPKIAYADDGPPFLDALNLIRHVDQFPEHVIVAEKIRTLIEEALQRSIYEPTHYEKLRWLAIYWNGVAAERGAKRINFPQEGVRHQE